MELAGTTVGQMDTFVFFFFFFAKIKFKKKDVFQVCIYGCCVYMHVCVPLVCNAHEGQKRVLDPLELEL